MHLLTTALCVCVCVTPRSFVSSTQGLEWQTRWCWVRWVFFSTVLGCGKMSNPKWNLANQYELPSLKLTWHLKMDGWKTTFLLGRLIFRDYVSFREGRHKPPIYHQWFLWGHQLRFGSFSSFHHKGNPTLKAIPGVFLVVDRMDFSAPSTSTDSVLCVYYPGSPNIFSRQIVSLGGFKCVLCSPLFGEDSHFD